MITAIWIAAAGFAGALLRFGLGALIARRRSQSPFPWGTFVINITGAFTIGLLYGIGVSGGTFSPRVSLVLGTGLVGAYTTFSTWALETMRLVRLRDYLLAGANLAFGVGAGLAATAMGYAVGRHLHFQQG